jgi:hypothetical protein
MTIRAQIEAILKGLSLSDRIALLESLGKKYRRINSIKINNLQYGRKVDERPDEINMK